MRGNSRERFTEHGRRIRIAETEKGMDGIGAALKKEERGIEKGECKRGSKKERGGTRWLQNEGERTVTREKGS